MSKQQASDVILKIKTNATNLPLVTPERKTANKLLRNTKLSEQFEAASQDAAATTSIITPHLDTALFQNIRCFYVIHQTDTDSPALLQCTLSHRITAGGPQVWCAWGRGWGAVGTGFSMGMVWCVGGMMGEGPVIMGREENLTEDLVMRGRRERWERRERRGRMERRERKE